MRSLAIDVKVRKLEKVGDFVNEVQQTAADWMRLRGVTPTPDRLAPWREAWHCDRVQVWGRVAESAEESEAIRWLHGPYQEAIPQVGVQEGSIYRSSVTGQVGQIGRIWHRMFPLVRMVKDPKSPDGKPIPKETRQYFELLTIFPDDSPESDDLLAFLENQPKPIFQKLWGK
jgi:CRISPR-associated protein Cmr6